MIVQPDFPEHWKTLLLIKLTADESAPLAVIRLWAHCQHSRRSYFPDMTPAQLASICRWGERKPACHVALIKAGFVEKLTPKGFCAHQWSEHNAQLLQKWAAGQKGGRPPLSEKPNDDGHSEKPTDNRPLTGTKPDRPDRPEETRSEQTEKTRPDPTAADAVAALRAGLVGSSLCVNGSGDGDGLVGQGGQQPSESEVVEFMSTVLRGGSQFAPSFLATMTEQNWCDQTGKPIKDWRKLASKYAINASDKAKRKKYVPNLGGPIL